MRRKTKHIMHLLFTENYLITENKQHMNCLIRNFFIYLSENLVLTHLLTNNIVHVSTNPSKHYKRKLFSLSIIKNFLSKSFQKNFSETTTVL